MSLRLRSCDNNDSRAHVRDQGGRHLDLGPLDGTALVDSGTDLESMQDVCYENEEGGVADIPPGAYPSRRRVRSTFALGVTS